MESNNSSGSQFGGGFDDSQSTKVTRFNKSQISLANHPATDGRTLAKLAKSQCAEIVVRVAEHANALPDTLNDLSNHQDVDVRISLAQNSNTPLSTLLKLARDHHLDVRFALAENPNISPAVLIVLTADENPYVSCRALKTMKRLGSCGQGSSMATLKIKSSKNRSWRQGRNR